MKSQESEQISRFPEKARKILPENGNCEKEREMQLKLCVCVVNVMLDCAFCSSCFCVFYFILFSFLY